MPHDAANVRAGPVGDPPTGWPDVAALSARMGVPFNSPADQDDANGAVWAAYAYADTHSTVWHREQAAGAVEPGVRVWRGTLDLAAALYERRGTNVDPFDALPSGMLTHFQRLLGVGRFAFPSIVGAT